MHPDQAQEAAEKHTVLLAQALVITLTAHPDLHQVTGRTADPAPRLVTQPTDLRTPALVVRPTADPAQEAEEMHTVHPNHRRVTQRMDPAPVRLRVIALMVHPLPHREVAEQRTDRDRAQEVEMEPTAHPHRRQETEHTVHLAHPAVEQHTDLRIPALVMLDTARQAQEVVAERTVPHQALVIMLTAIRPIRPAVEQRTAHRVRLREVAEMHTDLLIPAPEM